MYREKGMYRLVFILAAVGVVTLDAAMARACDVCAVYTATEQREARQGFLVGVSEQLSRFTTLQDDGEQIDNPGEHLTSSITQLLLGYDFNSRIGLQFILPVIARDYRRREDGVITSGNETGIGDVSLIGTVRPFHYVTERSVIRTALLGGLKFPTGSADRLREELEEDHHGDEDEHEGEDEALTTAGHEHHGGVEHGEEDEGPIGVHGHDLALGSGSFDGIIGGAFYASWDRFFWTTGVQYAIRTEGDFDYRYANDLTWIGGPGVYPYLAHDSSVSLQAVVSGEYKGKDTQKGEDLGDTAITSVYMGPGVGVTWGTSLGAEIAADFPILQDNSDVQIVRDYRLRVGASWRF